VEIEPKGERDVMHNTRPDPIVCEIQAARRRLKEMLHDLQDRGFDKTSWKHMVYSSREWTQGRSKGEAD
jgi:hypothetical protein